MKNPIVQFFVFSSGASSRLLDQCPDAEKIKYAAIGATIVITSILAFFSGSYALFTIFKKEWIAISFGVVWALMIFNLDRLIVSSIRKRKGARQFFQAIPRIFLALIIALVISKPLEIKLLESRIEKELFEQRVEKTDVLSAECVALSDEIDKKIRAQDQKIVRKEEQKPAAMLEYENRIKVVEKELAAEVPKVKKRSQRYYDRVREAKEQLNNLGIDTGIEIEEERERLNELIKYNNRKIYQNKRPLRKLETQIAKEKSKRDEVFSIYMQDLKSLKLEANKEKERLREEREETLAECQGTLASGRAVYADNTLPDYIEAISTAGEKNSTIMWISRFLMLLFVAVEITPILVKLITPRGPYDDLLDQEELTVRVASVEQMNQLKHELNVRTERMVSSSTLEFNKDEEIKKRTLDLIADAQEDIIRSQVEKWRDDEIRKLPDSHLEEE